MMLANLQHRCATAVVLDPSKGQEQEKIVERLSVFDQDIGSWDVVLNDGRFVAGEKGSSA